MRLLLFIPLLFTGCVNTTTQSNILARAKAEVSKRENWAEQAYIRVERRPSQQYVFWRDLTWKVSAGAYDYSGYPKYTGINVHSGTERELKFSRDGCLLDYKSRIRGCVEDSYSLEEPAPVVYPQVK